MTIVELAGPVLLRVLPTTVAVLLATVGAATLPIAVPRFITWLKGPAPEAHAVHHAPHHAHPHPHHGDDAAEREHTYSI